MIRNVCIHVTNEQPLVADLFDVPNASDAGLLCTNVRSLDGKRPVFIDNMAATFFFPYRVIRFLEIPEGAADLRRFDGAPDAAGHAPDDGSVPGADRGNHLPAVVGGPRDGDSEGDPELELEIDEDFLQRIRDI